MKVISTDIPDVMVLEPRVFRDERGFFMESYNRRSFKQATGVDAQFVQDNTSFSARNVVRGLHYQIQQAQGKLIQVMAGEIFDVAVDLRRGSQTFKQWVGIRLSGGVPRLVWIPEGFAHGFLVLSEHATLLYKTTDYYAPEHERAILWNDPELGIRWPIESKPIVSEKDRLASSLHAAEMFD